MPPYWCHHAFLWLALQSLGIKWEAVIELFHNYFCIIQCIEIRENKDFCQCLPHKPKQPQEFYCFPRWQEKSETSHCAWDCSTVHFNYICHWKHLVMRLLKNQHLRLPDPKFPFPILNQYSWQKQSWLFSIRSDVDLSRTPVWGGAEFTEWKSVPDRNYIPFLLHVEMSREGGWNSGGIRRMKFVFFYSTETKAPHSCQRHLSKHLCQEKKVLLNIERCNYTKLCRGKWDSVMHEGLRRRKWGRFCGFHGISLPVNQLDLKSWAEQSFWLLLLL